MPTETNEMRTTNLDNDLRVAELRAAERAAKRRRADLLDACRRAVECLEHFAAEARSRLERAAELEGARLLELPSDVLSATTWGAANAASKLSGAPQVAAEYMNALAEVDALKGGTR
jgi:hypothetical protein